MWLGSGAWCRPVATAPIAWKPPCAVGAAPLKKKKEQEKRSVVLEQRVRRTLDAVEKETSYVWKLMHDRLQEAMGGWLLPVMLHCEYLCGKRATRLEPVLTPCVKPDPAGLTRESV